MSMIITSKLKQVSQKVLRSPGMIIASFVIVGLITLLISFAYSLPTKSVSISLNSCTIGIRCYDGAAVNSGSIALNGSGVTPGCNSGGRFNIVGNQIVDPNCKVFVPVGANIAAPGYTFHFFGDAKGHSADVKRWGWNTIRLTMVCGNANGTNDFTSLYSNIDSIVQEYTTQKMVVMLECHDFTGSNNTNWASIYPYWDTVAAKYKNNPYVWLNIANEPYSSTDNTGWVNTQTTAYNHIRAIAPYNIFVADIDGYGQDIGGLKNGTLRNLGNGKCNVLYSWHDYGAIQSWDPNINLDDATATNNLTKTIMDYMVTNKIPLVVGEFGTPIPLSATTAASGVWNMNGANATLNNAPSHGVGILWWHATGDSNISITYNLMNGNIPFWNAGANGENTSPTGLLMWQKSHGTVAGQGATFSGDLTSSNCK